MFCSFLTSFYQWGTSHAGFFKYLAWSWQTQTHQQAFLGLHSPSIHALPGPLGNTSFPIPTSCILKKLDSLSTGRWRDLGDSSPSKASLIQIPQCSRLTCTSNTLRAHVISPVARAGSIQTINMLEHKGTAKASVYKPVSLSRWIELKADNGTSALLHHCFAFKKHLQ